MKNKDIARVCHEANRALQIIANDPAVSAPWDTAADWQRDSAIEGVAKALDGATPEQLHQSWCDFKIADGWMFGEIKDEGAKTHPCLVDYADLPADQRVKDAVFSAICTVLASHEGEDQ